MPSHITDHTFGQAIVDSVYNGSYPESEEVVSAELPQSALPTILELIDQAREDVKVDHAFFQALELSLTANNVENHKQRE